LEFDAIDGCIRVLGWTSARMKGLEATGSVEDDTEVASKWWGECSRARFWVNLCKATLAHTFGESRDVHTHLVVNETPLLQKSVHTHESAYVACKIPSARSDGEVLGRPETIGVDHKVPIILVD
jgi:hypothetical protein